MRKEILEQMTAEELKEYAIACGIKESVFNKSKDKAGYLHSRWEREVPVTVFGQEFKIKAKTLQDKRFIDLVGSPNPTDEQLAEALTLLLGEEQVTKLYDVCTDEDGTVDIVAVGQAFVHIANSPQLKN
jgi:hypothetical protein